MTNREISVTLAKILSKTTLRALTAIAMSVLFAYSCTDVLERQAHADYQKCLSWQADGYDVQCDESKYR